MNKQWHRDRIKELKNKISDLKFSIGIGTSIVIALISLLYNIIRDKLPILTGIFTLLIILIIFIRNILNNIIKHNNQIKKNYDILLNRKKQSSF